MIRSRYVLRDGLGVLAGIAVAAFLVTELMLMATGMLSHAWTPYAIGNLTLVAGALVVVAVDLARRQQLSEALRRGAVIAGSLYVVFLFATVGLMEANKQAIQLPMGMGPVYRYDPPNSRVMAAKPESVVVAYLERERALPVRATSLIPIGGTFGFETHTELYPVLSYEVGPVLIRQVPNEVWWDDDPTFVATVNLSVEFADAGRRDMVVELLSASRDRDFLGLYAQGYLTPSLESWRPNWIRAGN